MMHRLPDDSSLKQSKSRLGGRKLTMVERRPSTYDLVGQMMYLYVRVVRAWDLPSKDGSGSCDPYVEVRMRNYRGRTRVFEKTSNPYWDSVFAFSKERIQTSVLEVAVQEIAVTSHDFMGWVLFDLNEVPLRVPPDSPLAPQWYRLNDRKGKKLQGELMLGVWWGTQADEAFLEAWHPDASSVGGSDHTQADIRSKVYYSPRLWYLRVHVIAAKDLVPNDENKFPKVIVNVTLGFQSLKTKTSMSRSVNPIWNEELLFVAAEPFENQHLRFRVEDRSAPHENDIKVLGMCAVDLQNVEQRLDHKAIINAKWYNLDTDVTDEGEKKKEVKFASGLHMRLCLEGGYHVVDESTVYSSDLRPTARQLWKKSVGVLEFAFLGAHGLLPMKIKDGRETTDAYCVAKYGTKWVRTRTITDSFNPKWNEQYTWEVFDPCTVITICVFDNRHLNGEGSDSKIGKVRIRVSTLEPDHVYTNTYPLYTLHPSGLKKMGEIHLAMRFSCPSLLNLMHMYSQPLLPEMHDILPLSDVQLESSMHQATHIISMKFSQADPPLSKEVVEYMLEADSHMWSMRRSKANFFRLMGVFGGLIAVGKWFDEIRNWNNTCTTLFIHVIFVVLVLYPEFIFPSIFMCIFLLGLWNRRWKPRRPPHTDTRLSCADNAHPDELDEEFDTFPTSLPEDIVRMRYDRLRSISGTIQTVAGDLATQGERIQSLISWRDPTATTLFVFFCLIAAVLLYAKPFYVVVIQIGFTLLSHPRFQHKLPLVPLNFLRRLPARTDCML